MLAGAQAHDTTTATRDGDNLSLAPARQLLADSEDTAVVSSPALARTLNIPPKHQITNGDPDCRDT